MKNSFDKIRIVVMQNGAPVGYIKSMSYTNSKYSMTRDKAYAKTYSNPDSAMRDIDYATRFSFPSQVTFAMG